LAKRISPNETWVIVPIYWHSENNLLQPHYIDHYVLKGYNSNTKEKLHEYGPFDSEQELHQFAREHAITITKRA
jgi:hypothetical protein